MSDYRVRDDGTMSDDYREPVDIRKFCRGLEEAWKLTPDLTLSEILESIFDGYNLEELTTSEMDEMLNDYILQNQ